ncbi:MAG: hypothetical protein AB1499_17930, partial [Nitrospirota bacterium]
ILINQVRADIGHWMPPGRVSGEEFKSSEAHAIKHGLTCRILLTPGGTIRDKDNKTIMDKVTKRPLGKIIRWKILKGKCGFHEGAEGEWNYYYENGVNLLEDFVLMAIQFVERKGPYYIFMDQNFQGKESLFKFFQKNPDKIEEAKRLILSKKGLIYRY